MKETKAEKSNKKNPKVEWNLWKVKKINGWEAWAKNHKEEWETTIKKTKSFKWTTQTSRNALSVNKNSGLLLT